VPRPNSQSREVWIREAACRGADNILFFPEDGRSFGSEAEKLCADCPVLEPCQEWAVYHEAFGYQGGLTPNQRAKVRARLNIYLWEPQMNVQMVKGVAS